jgi:hypothetical protein
VHTLAGENVDPRTRVAAEQDRDHLATLGVAHVVRHLRRGGQPSDASATTVASASRLIGA